MTLGRNLSSASTVRFGREGGADTTEAVAMDPGDLGCRLQEVAREQEGAFLKLQDQCKCFPGLSFSGRGKERWLVGQAGKHRDGGRGEEGQCFL